MHLISISVCVISGVKFSSEEERIVIDLQGQFGNKWARIATYLPGRTDNDVKNFWSSRQKRLARVLQTPPQAPPPPPPPPPKSHKSLREPPSLHKVPTFEVNNLISIHLISYYKNHLFDDFRHRNKVLQQKNHQWRHQKHCLAPRLTVNQSTWSHCRNLSPPPPPLPPRRPQACLSMTTSSHSVNTPATCHNNHFYYHLSLMLRLLKSNSHHHHRRRRSKTTTFSPNLRTLISSPFLGKVVLRRWCHTLTSHQVFMPEVKYLGELSLLFDLQKVLCCRWWRRKRWELREAREWWSDDDGAGYVHWWFSDGYVWPYRAASEPIRVVTCELGVLGVLICCCSLYYEQVLLFINAF